MLELRVARAGAGTGRILRTLLEERGVQVARRGHDADAGVSYGQAAQDPQIPWLNADAGRLNKYNQFRQMRDAGVRVPTFSRHMLPMFSFLGRWFRHQGGTDIVVYRNLDHALSLPRREFYVQLIPSTTEYRHWIYRGRHLGTYEKVKVRAPMAGFTTFGRNYANGYAFQLVHQAQVDQLRPSIAQATAAVAALKLDFGAVDVLAGTDGLPYVLEVNSSPGVEDGRRVGIIGLANKIARWIELGYPKRKGEDAD